MAEVFELFPTPVQRLPSVLAPQEAQALARRFAAQATLANDRSGELSHTRILGPGDDPALPDLVTRLGPLVQEFGALIFGEQLRWLVKELWVNVLGSGGRQAVHNHANCFVSVR